MQPEYWHDRWQRGDTGWHRDAVMPLLQKHWPVLRQQPDEQVLVPLCGKTLDMPWLAAQGQRVLGIEVNARGIAEFFAGQGVQPDVVATPHGRLHRAGDIAILQADALTLNADALSGCRLVYDRAALIALPPDLRRRYVDALYAALPSGSRGLLITLDYPQQQKAGPPFSVDAVEVHALFDSCWTVALLERREILAQQPGFVAAGVTALHTAVYRLHKRD